MVELPVMEQVQKYTEAGKVSPDTIMVDDLEVLKNESSKISKLVIYWKKFVWGIEISYSDGSSTGIHAGHLEPETPPKSQELILEDNEYLEQISGYVNEYIGALHIKTTLDKTLDIGNSPLGSLFVFGKKGHIIKRLTTGYNGYLTYIGVFMTELMPVTHSANSLILMTEPLIGYDDGLYNRLSYRNSLMSKPITEIFGQDSPTSIKFNDYEELVEPILRERNNVRISRIKLYKNKTGIIGIKTVYTMMDRYGKVTKHERPHKSKAVNFFTSRSSMNFGVSEYPFTVAGSFTNHVTYLKVTSTTGKTMQLGKEQGLKFIMQSKNNKYIIAFAGSFDGYLYTLRAYYMED